MSVDTDARSTETPVGMARRVWPSAVAVLFVALVGVLAALPLLTPSPAGADAPTADFSAARAYNHIQAVAQGPRPTGSQAGAQARAYLLRTLSELGLSPIVTTRPVCRVAPGGASCGIVNNVRATIPGRDPTGTVVFVAHYDSVVDGPGASDDGLGLSTLLETARALAAGPPPRNDLLFLFTDGEEPGLLGSRAATEAGDLPEASRSVVLNLEARGNSGPVVMFETGEHNVGVVTSMRDYPGTATSFASTVYALLPNDTDFSEFRRVGMTGMNFAVVGGSVHYDNALDTVDNVDRGSLQDMGNAVLSAGWSLANDDLTAVNRDGRATFFPVFGALVTYPRLLTTAVAVLAILALPFILWYARRRTAMRLSAVGLAVGGFVGALLASAAVGLAAWELLLLARPDYVGFVLGDPYRPEPAYLGLTLVALGLVFAWWGLTRRRATAVECAAAMTATLALLTLAGVTAAPDAAYVVAWPTLAGTAALGLAAWQREDSPWQVLVWALPGSVAMLVLAPIAILLFPTAGLAMTSAALLFVSLLAGTVVAGLALPTLRRRVVAAVTVSVLVAGVSLVSIGTVVDRVDARHPRLISLIYGLDADTGTATWLSPYPVPEPFVDHYVTGPGRPWTNQFPVLRSPRYRSGTGRVVPVATPTIQLLGSTQAGDGRRLRLRLAVDSPAATMLALYVDTDTATVVDAQVAGRPVPGGVNRPASDPWRWGFTFVGPLTEGCELDLTVAGTGPVRVRVVAQSPGLPAQAMDVPMQATVTGAISAAVQTLATRTATF